MIWEEMKKTGNESSRQGKMAVGLRLGRRRAV